MSVVEVQRDLWDRRYKNTGHLWGEGPSSTVILLRKALDRLYAGSDQVRRVITIGAGTGRDEVHLSANGARVKAFELSASGIKLGKALAKKSDVAERIEWKLQDFSTSSARKAYDALLSHRTLHLLDDNQVIKFRRKASLWVKPGGVLAVSARNYEDFDSDQMQWVSQENGVAEYKDPERAGHVIHFWNEAKFEDTFGEDFDIRSFSRETEIESIDNVGKQSNITIMVATRKLGKDFISASQLAGSEGARNTLAQVAAERIAVAMRGFSPVMNYRQSFE